MGATDRASGQRGEDTPLAVEPGGDPEVYREEEEEEDDDDDDDDGGDDDDEPGGDH